MPDSLAYRGEARPEQLTEDVVFRSSLIAVTSASFLICYFGIFILGFLFIGATTLVGGWELPHSARPIFWILSGGASIACVFWSYRTLAGFTATFNRDGISVKKGGELRQSCPWSETTRVTRGKGWRKSDMLGDQFGKPIWRFGLESTHPDRTLVTVVMRTRLAELRAQESANANSPVKLMSWWTVLAVAAFGACCFPALAWSKEQLMASLSSDSPSMASRAAYLAATVLTGFGFTSSLLFALIVAKIRMLSAADKQEREKVSQLVEFIQAHNGKLEAISMENGVWYRYTSPDQLRRSEEGLAAGLMMIVLCLIVAAFALAATANRPDATSSLGPIFALLTPLIATGVYSAVRGFQLRRGLECSLRSFEGNYEIRLPHGATIRARLLKPLAANRARSNKVGYLSMSLRGADGKTYRVDPRYLIPSQAD